ncbi:MAG: very short patch repair endonuclease [Nevskiales bacterium]
MVTRRPSPSRSKMMAAVKGRDTSPEMYVRRMLFAAGFRFRLHDARLPGRPDIVLSSYRTAIFVNGCFWHGHSCKRGLRPTTNTNFWNRKLDANKKRDKRNRRLLKAAGWTPVVIWTCETKEGAAELLRVIRRRRLAR